MTIDGLVTVEAARLTIVGVGNAEAGREFQSENSWRCNC